ncbi:MAG: glutathione S-transferase family protein [Rhizobiales bacterium]|nr:glutathione S-transferase family protein [Hyphomicrobiales bacterium]
MYKLYNVKTWGSLAPHCVLEELGVPYQNIWMTPEQVRDPKFKEISPLGLVPVLGLPDGRPIVESAAIIAFLTDAHADKKLAPAPGEADHAEYLSFLVFMSVNLYQMFSVLYAPGMLADTDAEKATVTRRATENANAIFDLIEARLAKEGPYILGERFSAADIYLFMLSLWARPSETEHLARCPHIARVCAAVRARPKLKAALEAHGVMEPGGYGA